MGILEKNAQKMHIFLDFFFLEDFLKTNLQHRQKEVSTILDRKPLHFIIESLT